MRASIHLTLAFVLLVACHPSTASQAPDRDGRDGLGSPLGDTCASLRKSGCPEGAPGFQGETCFERLTRESALAEVPTACVAAAKAPEIIRACGTVSTIRFRCLTGELSDGGTP
jgi:hypothetical protein